MRILAFSGLVTLISGFYEMPYSGTGRALTLVSILHVTAGLFTLAIAAYNILFPRRLP